MNMKKGSIFLLAAFAILAASLYYLSFQYERPNAATPESESPPLACGLNASKLAAAMAADCRAATFQLPSPLNESDYLDGSVIGGSAGGCEVLFEEPNTGDSMRCYLTEPLSRDATTYKGIEKKCSGRLAERIATLF